MRKFNEAMAVLCWNCRKFILTTLISLRTKTWVEIKSCEKLFKSKIKLRMKIYNFLRIYMQFPRSTLLKIRLLQPYFSLSREQFTVWKPCTGWIPKRLLNTWELHDKFHSLDQDIYWQAKWPSNSQQITGINKLELLRSQEPTTGSCPKPNKSSPRPPTLFLDLPY